jgi:hypothetical protein
MTQEVAKVKRGGHAMTQTQQVGKPERRGNGWFVPSGAVGYYVERLEGRWRCTCPSFVWRHTRLGGDVLVCKHIRRVMDFMKEESMV